jgi:aryl-alcohol dehydrogenase-like predicted oxidoreductase
MGMKAVPLGNSGTTVSNICLGAMFFGSKTDRSMSHSLLDCYVDAGGSFIDTANIYAWWVPGFAGGESETVLGEWMRRRKNRSRLFLASKVGFGYGSVKVGLTAALIRSECEKSLRRLGVETIDLYFAHVDDRNTRQEETLEALHRLVSEGKVRFLGASNFLAWRLAEAEGICRERSWPGYCCIQQRYTYLRPQPGTTFGAQIAANDDLFDYCVAHGMSLLAYSPLLGGAYSRADRSVPEQYRGADTEARMSRLKSLARDLGKTENQIVLAWLMQSKPAAIPLAAGSTVEQLRENLGAGEVKLTADQVAWLSSGGAS